MADDDDKETSNKGWLIGGATVGAVMVLVVIGFLVYLCVRKCGKKSGSGGDSTGSGSSDPGRDGVARGKPEESVSGAPNYFIDLAKKTHVKSISDWKKQGIKQ
jgi:hypothetical protein